MPSARDPISAAVPRGVQTFLFEEAYARSAIAATIFSVIKAWSFDEVALPVFDYYDAFAQVAGDDLVRKTLRFVDPEGQLVAVRSDFTPLVAKVVATRMANEPVPLRLCYQGDVVRHEAPRAGAQSDFWQIGAELVGVPERSGEAEILAVVSDALTEAGAEGLVFAVSHADLVETLLDGADRAARTRVREALDRRDSARLQEAARGLPHEAALVSLLRWLGPAPVLSQARSALGAEAAGALDELAELDAAWRDSGLPGALTFDLADVRGTGYYTGMKFRVFVPGVGVPLGGGGRYDDLIGRFGVERPAVGFSLYLDRLVQVLAAHHRDDSEPHTLSTDRAVAAALREARQQRRAGRRVRVEHG